MRHKFFPHHSRSLAVTFATTAFSLLVVPVFAFAAAPLSISVSGNHFINGSGQTVQLVGVNRSSTEYACFDGYAYASGPLDASDATAIAGWHANAVRVPLNEACWLGLNGSPAGGLTAIGYQQAIEAYVQQLHALGLYAILDLHWTGPGTTAADGQRAMPDAHSLDFWTSVATAFRADPASIFDAFNEPYSPAANGNAGYPLDWACWENGGCVLPDANDQQSVNPTQTYTAVGMQAVVNAIRATGANQPILLGGLSYANDLSGWLTHEPTDPAGQLAASFHNYTGEACATVSCWNATILPVAAQVPVVTGEFGETDCPSSGDDPNNFDNTYMGWADQNGIGYLGWGWFVLTPPQTCDALYLITDYSGAPAAVNGVALHDHLTTLFTTPPPQPAPPPLPVGPVVPVPPVLPVVAPVLSPSVAPKNITLPKVSGKAKSKNKLVASNGTYTGTAPFVFKYQWESCSTRGQKCKAIRGATRNNIRLTRKDIGRRMEIVVTVANSAGKASVASKATSIVRR